MDLGPTWLRLELPHPIAHAWNLSLSGRSLDGMAAAGAVEVALRFVTALQAATLLVEGQRLPTMLRDGGFKRPTLGSWAALARTLKPLVKRPIIGLLADWPDDATEARLGELVRLRNQLAHHQMSPAAREELDRRLAELAAELLETLAPLRRATLFTVIDQRPAARGSEGRLQVLRGVAAHPPPHSAAWSGELEIGQVYLAADDGRQALPLAPFVERARLRGERLENTCLWKAVGERGDVLLSDDGNDATEWRRLPERPRIVPYQRQRRSASSTDATRHEGPALEAPTLTYRSRARRRRGALTVVGIIVALGLLAATAALIVGRGGDGEAAATDPVMLAPGDPCPLPDLADRWRFETRVLHTKPQMEYGLNARGTYEVTFRAANDCRLLGDLTKTGWVQGGQRTDLVQRQMALPFEPDPQGRTIASRASLRRADDPSVLEMSLRVTRYGSWIVGLWRHEGAEWARGGYSGALVGRRSGDPAADGEEPPHSFFDCVAHCHDGDDPRDAATATCLLDCARRLDD